MNWLMTSARYQAATTAEQGSKGAAGKGGRWTAAPCTFSTTTLQGSCLSWALRETVSIASAPVPMQPPTKPSHVFLGDSLMSGVRPKKKPDGRGSEGRRRVTLLQANFNSGMAPHTATPWPPTQHHHRNTRQATHPPTREVGHDVVDDDEGAGQQEPDEPLKQVADEEGGGDEDDLREGGAVGGAGGGVGGCKRGHCPGGPRRVPPPMPAHTSTKAEAQGSAASPTGSCGSRRTAQTGTCTAPFSASAQSCIGGGIGSSIRGEGHASLTAS